MDYGYLSLVPIFMCLFLVFISKNAMLSILGGILTGSTLIIIKEKSAETIISSAQTVIQSTSTLQIILFVLLIGALSSVMTHSGGVTGLIRYFEGKKSSLNSKISIQLFAIMIGMLMFVDASSSMAITAVVGKPLFTNAKIPREKLALITNSTASPIAWIVPFGGAAAMTSGILMQVSGFEENSFSYVLKAIPYQFYTISLLLFLIVTITFDFEIGTMKRVQFVEDKTIIDTFSQNFPKARNIIVPTIVLMSSIFILLYITGGGNIFTGNGASSVFYAGVIAIIFTFLFYLLQGIVSTKEYTLWLYDGVKSMLPITVLLFVAFIFSNILAGVGTANYLLNIFDFISADYLPFFIFIIASIIAYCTGTSSGTVAIVTPLVIPMALLEGGNIPLALGAIISGAVFGDQNSIISDSAIVTSSVTGVDVISHLKTQMPYTMVAFSIAAVLYLIFGFIY